MEENAIHLIIIQKLQQPNNENTFKSTFRRTHYQWRDW